MERSSDCDHRNCHALHAGAHSGQCLGSCDCEEEVALVVGDVKVDLDIGFGLNVDSAMVVADVAIDVKRTAAPAAKKTTYQAETTSRNLVKARISCAGVAFAAILVVIETKAARTSGLDSHIVNNTQAEQT